MNSISKNIMNHYFFKCGTHNCLAEGLIFNAIKHKNTPQMGVFYIHEAAEKIEEASRKKQYRYFNELKNIIKKENCYFWNLFNGQIIGLKPTSEVKTPVIKEYPECIIEYYKNLLKKKSGDSIKQDILFLDAWAKSEPEIIKDRKIIDELMDRNKDNYLDWIKIWECECVAIETDILKIPRVLLGMTGNQSINRPTFSKIKNDNNFGTIKAIEYILQRPDQFGNRSSIEINEIAQIFQCLSPAQFETLVFLIFHEKGMHCSAYQGKSLENFDLLVSNPQGTDIGNIGGADFNEKGIKIQVKQKLKFELNSADCWLIFLGNNNLKEKKLGLEWLCNAVLDNKRVKEWIKSELFWIQIQNKLFQII